MMSYDDTAGTDDSAVTIVIRLQITTLVWVLSRLQMLLMLILLAGEITLTVEEYSMRLSMLTVVNMQFFSKKFYFRCHGEVGSLKPPVLLKQIS